MKKWVFLKNRSRLERLTHTVCVVDENERLFRPVAPLVVDLGAVGAAEAAAAQHRWQQSPLASPYEVRTSVARKASMLQLEVAAVVPYDILRLLPKHHERVNVSF